jgi:hypothetical protein
MRKYLLAITLLLSSVFPAKVGAQARVYLGVEGEGNFGNYGLGPTASLEVPLGKHFEVDAGAKYEPLASHVKLGDGYNYSLSTSGIGWFTNGWGLYGGLDNNAYSAGAVYKDQPHVFGGFVHRGIVDGLPSRFFFGYAREIQNGISPNGTETNHLNAFNVDYQVRFGCKGATCFRLDFNNYAGWVLNQGNPVCDGTYGVTGGNGPNGSCPRQKTLSGGTSFSFTFEFPRRHGHESEVF